VSTRLERIRFDGEALQRFLAESFDTAYAIDEPAGSCDAWAAVCVRWGVCVLPESDREQIRSGQRPLRGAPILELREVIVAIVFAARHSLRSVDTFNDDPADAEKDRLLRITQRAETELVDAYSRAVLPKRKGMFANATAHVTPGAASAMPAIAAHTLRCRHCGAPRFSDRDFECVFCGQQMA
jgi:hypothetical protein